MAAADPAAFPLVGKRLSLPQLAGWSFLMSSAHGAGLMLLPVVARPGGHHHGSLGLMIALIHTLAMFAVAGAIAIAVYEFVGLRILRSAWINVDRVWAFALVGAGVFALLPGDSF